MNWRYWCRAGGAMWLALPLAACGGGGSSGTGTAPVAADAPAASSMVTGTISRSDGTATTVTSTAALPTAVTATQVTTIIASPGSTAASTAATVSGSTAALPTAASVPAVSNPTTASVPATRKSISGWATCNGADETANVAKALSAAKNGAFTLVVDCPMTLKVGADIARTLFIDQGTSVEFTGAGKFTINNAMIPAFVIADSSNINLINWNVEYDGGIPVVEMSTYENNGVVVGGKPGNAFNDLRLTRWLAANRGVVFDGARGAVNSEWTGTTNASAVFYITGDSSNVTVSGLHLYVPQNAGGNQFIPVAFTLAVNFKRNQKVLAGTDLTGEYFAVPHSLVFTNITLDGTYMGWVGGLQNASFSKIHSLRYGDLQDAAGNNVGGIAKWFAPPHLFYFNYTLSGDKGLFNTNIDINDVADDGIRVGKARDNGDPNDISGYANSLKIGCVTCTVQNYVSSRPDGLMDILNVDGLTLSNVTGTYNSAFTHNMYAGWRFPSTSYQNSEFVNVTLTDTAPSTTQGPIGNAGYASNQGLRLSNIQVGIKKWGNPVTPFPTIRGQYNNVALIYSITDTPSQHLKAQTGTVEAELQATPSTLRRGQTTTLQWLSRDANSCTGGDSLSGALTLNGARTARLTAAGVYKFSVTCRNSTNSTTATASIVVTP